ncbi:MAG: hypothetical protein GY855_17430, partial [candidate division Zixibacteria bacterium]|nr:hypothetical protein [candidate division Zixibacteria bacterium]
LKEAGITDISFNAIFSVNDALTPKFRSLAESVFNCKLLDSYGHMEGAVAISQCLQGGYHVNSDYGLLEFQNSQPSGTDNTSTEKTYKGQAVGTSLYNLAMPFIRYEVGDDIEYFTKPVSCSCGRSLPLVKAIHGRSEDTIITPDGKFITSLFIVPEFTEGARFVQFIQESRTSLKVNVVPDESWNDLQEETMSYYIEKLIGKNMSFHISRITKDDIIVDSSGKIRTVISDYSRNLT